MTVGVTPDNVLDIDLFPMAEEGTRWAGSAALHQGLRNYRSRGAAHAGASSCRAGLFGSTDVGHTR